MAPPQWAGDIHMEGRKMITWLGLWAFMAVSLALAVAALHYTYRAFGSDLGLKGPGSEAATVLVASAMQAAIVAVLVSLIGWRTQLGHAYVLTGLITWIVYKVTHLTEMSIEVGLVVLGRFIAEMAVLAVLLKIGLVAASGG